MSEKPPDYTLRAATEDDASQIAKLLKAIGWFSSLRDLSINDVELLVREHLHLLVESPMSTTLVAITKEGDVLGYSNVHWLTNLFMSGPEGYVSELFLQSDARGQGLGRAFLDHLVGEAKTRGAIRLSLLNGKHRESYERGFYTKNGWEERPQMANFVYWVHSDL
ncbi:MAG TPA: GNAT family N-acetyltransferase [Candidatus Paceibacterota bacterium]|nr:GNAT family N-acetyltransferase [Candidatus Paceibacterota bacterium]